MILLLVIAPIITVSAATFYTEQTTPEGHPPVTFFEMKTVDPPLAKPYVRLRFGFDEKEPFSDGMYSLEYIVLNNQKIFFGETMEYHPFIRGHVLSWLNLSYPADVKIGYSMNFDDLHKLPPSINGKWYLQEIKLNNKKYDIVQNNGYPSALYELEHGDLQRLPLISLNFGDTWEFNVGDVFDEPGYTAESTWNNEEVEDLTSDVSVNYGVIIPGEPIPTDGTFIITYSVEDSQGNIGTTQRLLIVGEAEPPTISNDNNNDDNDESDGDAWVEEDTSGEETTTFDLAEFINTYWWMIVLVIFIGALLITNSFVQAIVITVIALVIAGGLGFNIVEIVKESILEGLWEGIEFPEWLNS